MFDATARESGLTQPSTVVLFVCSLEQREKRSDPPARTPCRFGLNLGSLAQLAAC
jgi:hypothetical protein